MDMDLTQSKKSQLRSVFRKYGKKEAEKHLRDERGFSPRSARAEVERLTYGNAVRDALTDIRSASGASLPQAKKKVASVLASRNKPTESRAPITGRTPKAEREQVKRRGEEAKAAESSRVANNLTRGKYKSGTSEDLDRDEGKRAQRQFKKGRTDEAKATLSPASAATKGAAAITAGRAAKSELRSSLKADRRSQDKAAAEEKERKAAEWANRARVGDPGKPEGTHYGTTNESKRRGRPVVSTPSEGASSRPRSSTSQASKGSLAEMLKGRAARRKTAETFKPSPRSERREDGPVPGSRLVPTKRRTSPYIEEHKWAQDETKPKKTPQQRSLF